MRAVLLGTDFIKCPDGKLRPIEINTNTGLDDANRLESYEEMLDLTELAKFINEEHTFAKVYLEGNIKIIKPYLEALISIPVEEVKGIEALNELEEASTEPVLAIRTDYSDEALIDGFCRDKVSFFDIIRNKEYGCEFAFKDENTGEIENTFTVLPELKGMLPNVVVKYRYPQYDRAQYPAFYRFETLEELNSFIDTQLEGGYMVMPFYFTEEDLYEGKYPKQYRNWSILVAEDDRIRSIYAGTYTKLLGEYDEASLTYVDSKLEEPGRIMLLVGKWVTGGLGLLEAGDELLMADGSWKPIEEVAREEKVLGLYIPTESGEPITEHVADYNVSDEELRESSKFEQADIRYVGGRKMFIDYYSIIFEDGTDWGDTGQSSYMTVDPEDGTVRFAYVSDFKVGDKIYMLDVTDLSNPKYVIKEITDISVERKMITGYGLTVDDNHIFVSRFQGEESAYASIEHNMSECLCECRADDGIYWYYEAAAGEDEYCQDMTGYKHSICQCGMPCYPEDPNTNDGQCSEL